MFAKLVGCKGLNDSRGIATSFVNFISVKRFLDYSKVPKLNEKDLEVKYVRGAGPGGQATNKTNNAVMLKHVPTGIVVKSHQTRSQLRNKEIAEKILINKLDLLYNKEDAVENQEKRILKKMSNERKRRQKKRAALKQELKANELNKDVDSS